MTTQVPAQWRSKVQRESELSGYDTVTVMTLLCGGCDVQVSEEHDKHLLACHSHFGIADVLTESSNWLKCRFHGVQRMKVSPSWTTGNTGDVCPCQWREGERLQEQRERGMLVSSKTGKMHLCFVCYTNTASTTSTISSQFVSF